MKLVVNINDLLSKRLRLLADRMTDTRGLRMALGQVFVAGSKRRFAQGGDPPGSWKPSRRGGQTLVDRGRLRKSIHFRLVGDNSLNVGSNAPFANMHQHGSAGLPGGVVRSKRPGGMLAIPLDKTARGAKPRDFENTFIGRSDRSGKKLAIIYQRTGRGKGTNVRALFLLVESVTIPARPFVGYGEYEKKRVKTVARNWFAGKEVSR